MPWRSAAATAALLAVFATAAAQEAARPPATLCTAQERVMFHCALGDKAVSLCAEQDRTHIRALAFRYGTRDAVEVAYTATDAGSAHFSATATPLAPHASVRQLWFVRAGRTYLLSQCVGGACPHAAGLAILEGARILSNQVCERGDDDRAWFAQPLVHFGTDAAGTRALAPQLRIEDVDFGVERFYPGRDREH